MKISAKTLAIKGLQKSILPGISSLAVLVLLFACKTESSQHKETTTSASDSNKVEVTQKKPEADCPDLFKAARQADSILLLQNELDQAMANRAIKAFTNFAYYCPTNSLSPVYLIKTAQVARAINNIPQAKIALEYCMDGFANFKDRPAAIFLLAQLYDEPNYLNDEAEARKLYNKIVEEYPESSWALSAKGAIGFLGKSDAEILRELKKKSRQKIN